MFDFSKVTGNWAMDTFNHLTTTNPRSLLHETPFQTEIRFLESVPDATGHRQPILMSTDLANKDYPSKDVSTSTTTGVAVPLFIPPNTQHAQLVPLIDQNQVASHITGIEQIVPVTTTSHLTHGGMLTNPRQIIHHIWSVIRGTFGYVIWNYEDFVMQFQSWDGSVTGLLQHVGLLWRTMITVVITLGLLELGPLIDGLSRILMEIGELIMFTFRLVETTANEMWYFLNLLWEDFMIPIQWIRNQTTGL